MQLVMRLVPSVCVSVCPVHALTFESNDLETPFWYKFTSLEYLGEFCISRSSDQGQGHRRKGYTSVIKDDRVSITTVIITTIVHYVDALQDLHCRLQNHNCQHC